MVKPKTIYLYITILLAVYISGSVFISHDTEGGVSKSANLILAILMLPSALRNTLKGRGNIGKTFFILAVYCVLYTFYTYFIYSKRLVNLIFTFLLFLLMYLVICKNDKLIDKIKEAYINIILSLAMISFMFFVIDQILNIQLPYAIENHGVIMMKNYFSLYYTMSNTARNVLDITIYRLQSIFWEPGVFALHLNICLYLTLFSQHVSVSKFQIGLLLVCIILTFSTTGIIIATILFVTWLYLSLNVSSKIVFLIPLLIIVETIVYETYYSKRYVTSTASYSIRLNDLITGLLLWKDNFLLGIGYKNQELFLSTQSWNHLQTNGIIEICYTMGVFGFFFYFYPFFKHFSTIKCEKKIEYFLFCFMLILENMSEPFYTMPIILFILAVEYYKISKKNNYA